MRAIIHVGMPKTGSSSIQETFHAVCPSSHHYIDWLSANHSSMVKILFQNQVPANLSEHEVKDMCAKIDTWRAYLEHTLASQPAENVIFSAERIFNIRPVDKQILFDYFSRFCDDFLVVGYVRAPISYLQSAFQQNVKTGTDTLDLSKVWSKYRAKFEALDNVFGRERVSLRKFDPQFLDCGDVVMDFARQIDVHLDPADIIRVNESLSLEALALLFVQRRFGIGLDTSSLGWKNADDRFINALRAIGNTKLVFGSELVLPLVEQFGEDIAWMEQRLGVPILDLPKPEGRVINSEADLIDLALECSADVAALRPGKQFGTAPKTPESLARLLDELRNSGAVS